MKKAIKEMNQGLFEFFTKCPKVKYLQMELLFLGQDDDDDEKIQISIFEPENDKDYSEFELDNLKDIFNKYEEKHGESFADQSWVEDDENGDQSLTPEENSKDCLIIYAETFMKSMAKVKNKKSKV